MANSSDVSPRVTIMEFYCAKYPNLSQVPSVLDISYMVNAALNIPMALTATLGNILMLAVLPRTPSIHAPSKALLMSLALTDLAVGLVVQPLYVTYLLSCRKQNFELIRKLSYAYPLGYSLAFVSYFIMTAISLDRFLALHLRHRYREVVTLRRVKHFLAGIWISGALMVVLGLQTRYTYFALLIVVVPLCTLVSSVAFLNIHRKLRQQEIRVLAHAIAVIQMPPQQPTEEQRPNTSGYRNSVTSMVYVYCALLLCYLPYFFLALALRVLPRGWSVTTWLPARGFAQTLVFMNSSLNPLLYCWRIRDVRRVARTLFRQACGCGSG